VVLAWPGGAVVMAADLAECVLPVGSYRRSGCRDLAVEDTGL